MTLRRTPADFVVTERETGAIASILRHDASPDHPFAVYRLSKTSLTTPEGVGMLARALGVRPGAASYAGLKDKHAVTSQLVTLAAPPDAPDAARGPRWEATRLGWSPRHVRADDIDANAFTIVVRDLARETCIAMDRRRAALSRGDDLLVVNYFGDQRFGSARHGKGFAARALLRGDFETALRLAVGTPARKDSGRTRTFTRLCASHWGDWARLARDLPRCPERKPFEALARGATMRDAFASLPAFLQTMLVEAFQSHLWNDAARRLAAALGASGDLRSDDAFGPMLFLAAPAVTPGLEHLDLPLPAPGTQPREPWFIPMRDALAAEGITTADLRIPGLAKPYFGEAPRRFIVVVQGLRVLAPEPDDLTAGRLKRLVSFDLPRGAYATVVLRALGH